MSTVWLVEPDKMLRQAFTVALVPEFQIRVVDALPGTAPKDVDVLIVDAAALQEREPEAARRINALANWHLPIIWIDSDPPAEAPDRDQCIRLNRPVAKDALRRALAQCLSATTMAKSTVSAEPVNRPLRKKTRTKKAVEAATGEKRNIIELVDVFEEGA